MRTAQWQWRIQAIKTQIKKAAEEAGGVNALARDRGLNPAALSMALNHEKLLKKNKRTLGEGKWRQLEQVFIKKGVAVNELTQKTTTLN